MFAVWLGWRVYDEFLQPPARQDNGGQQAYSASMIGDNAENRFASRTRVDRVRNEAFQALSEVRRLADDHPFLLQQLINIERTFETGERRLVSGNLSQALVQFDGVVEQVADYRSMVESRRIANEIQGRFLGLLDELERSRRWSPVEYERAMAQGNIGRRFLDEGRFQDARRLLNNAVQLLGTMKQNLEAEVSERIVQGNRALAEGNSEAAAMSFHEILEIKPDHEAARVGLKRAETIEEVMALLDSANEKEQRDDLAGALEDYQAAYEKDRHSSLAQQGATRVKAEMDRREFDGLLARATTAEEENNWDEAIKTYQELRRKFPDREGIAQFIREAQESKKNYLIETHLNDAWEKEQMQRWQAAYNAYENVLELERGHPEAREGLMRTGEVVRKIISYERLIVLARNAADQGEFQQAIAIFNEAMSLKPSTYPLDDATRRLREELVLQSQPVEITFVSDNRTWVSVTGYKFLGRFREETEKIYPGNYQIRGRRQGHEDVVFTLRVRNGEPIGPVQVVANQRR